MHPQFAFPMYRDTIADGSARFYRLDESTWIAQGIDPTGGVLLVSFYFNPHADLMSSAGWTSFLGSHRQYHRRFLPEEISVPGLRRFRAAQDVCTYDVAGLGHAGYACFCI